MGSYHQRGVAPRTGRVENPRAGFAQAIVLNVRGNSDYRLTVRSPVDAAANRISIPEQAPGQGLADNRDILLVPGAFQGREFAPSHERDSERFEISRAHIAGFRVSALIA